MHISTLGGRREIGMTWGATQTSGRAAGLVNVGIAASEEGARKIEEGDIMSKRTLSSGTSEMLGAQRMRVARRPGVLATMKWYRGKRDSRR